MNKQHTTPLIIEGRPSNYNTKKLEKMSFGVKSHDNEEKLYDEYWIQNLIHENPSILPIEELESAFYPLYPVCRELKTPAGYLDNLFVSENGSLTLVECKLWRNPEARREVVGQALDYAKEFANWSYEDLSKAINDTLKVKGNFLFESVAKENPDINESTFVDSVSRNLKRGRFLLLIVGDGIREGVENISNFLQKHAGLDFTFGLVELGFYKIPDNEQYIIQPRVLARTYTIERSVIRTEGMNIKVETPEDNIITHKESGRKTNISEEQFFEQLTAINTELAIQLKDFIIELKQIDIFPVFGRSSLNLHWLPDGNMKMNFASIYAKGYVDTGFANYLPEKIGKVSIGHKYQQSFANLIPGAKVKEHEKQNSWSVKKDNKQIQLHDNFYTYFELNQIYFFLKTLVLIQ